MITPNERPAGRDCRGPSLGHSIRHEGVDERVPDRQAQPEGTRGQGIDPLVDLLVECCPSLAYTIAQTLVVEALDLSADLLLCEAWADTRQRLYPQAVRCAHNRHVGQSYADRHRQYLEMA